MTANGAGPQRAPDPGPTPSNNSPQMQQMLGASFNPQPFGYVVAKGTARGQACVFVTVETAIGRFALPFTAEEANVLGRLLLREASGLLLP